MRSPYPILTLAIALACAAFFAPPAGAQTCTPIEIAWPDAVDPVWELTALPPSLSTPPYPGSGLEVRDVRYRGISVLKQGHVPMINVRYETGCGCFRDWMYSNTVFEASNQTAACFAEPEVGTVQTVCDLGVGYSDIGSFRGIAMEDFGDGFTLTTQSQAGWYRYTIKWTFMVDGTILPEFGFSHTPSDCADNPRWHHAYWRFDFDIDTAADNYVAVSRDGGAWTQVPQESTDLWDDPAGALAPTRWAVFNHHSGRGYNLTPGRNEYLTPANPNTGNPVFDQFAKEDIAFSRYRPGQLTDGGGSCSVDFFRPGNAIVRDEDITSADVVVWYRTGATRLGGNGPTAPDTCEPLGPALRPIGDWNQPVQTEPPIAEERVQLEAFPNPSDGSTAIRFSMAEAQHVRITLFDALGREVRVLYQGQAGASTHELQLDGASLPSGIYTVHLAGEHGVLASRRIVIVR